MLAKYSRFNINWKISAVNLLNSGVAIYLSWIWLVIFFSILLICVSYSQVFLTELLTLSISFSTIVRAALVAKLVVLGIWLLTWFILALREALVPTLVISGILSSMFLILPLYTSFLTTPFFTTSLTLIKPTGKGTNLSLSNLSALLLKLF